MDQGKTLTVFGREEWRAWLAAHHQTDKGIWLVYYKKHTGRASVAYEASVEEALCFGWIDSLIRKLDEDRYARLFTPRTNDANWSPLNQRRFARMVRQRRMTPAGLAKAGFLAQGDRSTPRPRPGLSVPRFMQQALQTDQAAWDNFRNLAPSYRRQYIGWITRAKKEETRQKLLAEAIGLLAQNRKLGMR